jgi:hypothetical protein
MSPWTETLKTNNKERIDHRQSSYKSQEELYVKTNRKSDRQF